MSLLTVGQICNEIQEVQNLVFRLRELHYDNSSQYYALTIAWEALRFAWYVVHGDFIDADAKLDRVQSAIEWYLETRKK